MSLSLYNFVIIFSIFIVMLILCRRYTKIFNVLALFSILTLSVLILNLANINEVISILNLHLIANINSEFKMIGSIFLLVTFVAHLSGISQSKKSEIIIGSIYCLASLICLFAGDFISLFISLELMMLAATMLIFIGNSQESVKLSQRYFLTHLTSGSLILVGVSYIIAKTGSTEIISLTQFMNYNNEGFVFYILIFIGCLINVACVPFASWVINCYPAASKMSFIYLITFTTKISVVILIKLFGGFETLKFCGIAMIIYGGIYACIEENLKRILCYLTLSQLGFMLVLVGTGSTESISFVYSYIIVHILYTMLFATLLGILLEVSIETTWQIKRIQNRFVKISLLIGILTMLNFPFTSSFMLKLQLSDILNASPEYYLILLINGMVVLAIPFREYFYGKELVQIKMTKSALFTIIFALTILMVATIPVIVRSEVARQAYEVFISNVITGSVKQLIVITIGIILAFIIKISRKSTINMNFDLVGFVSNIRIYQEKTKLELVADDDKLIYQNITHSILDKITLLHNQQTAIFIVFCLLIILLIVSFNL
jgi:multicomponent Na+:H+ antiporter subunit D